MTKSVTYEEETNCGKIFVTFAEDETVLIRGDKNFKSGNCGDSHLSAYMEIINWATDKNHKTLKDLTGVFKGHRCEQARLGRGAKSCSDAIAKALSQHYKEDKC